MPKLLSVEEYINQVEKNCEEEEKPSKKEIEFMKKIETEIQERDKALINNLNPREKFVIVSVGKFHSFSAIAKLQKLGYKTFVYSPYEKTNRMMFFEYIKQKENIVEGITKTKDSDKIAIVIADVHTMNYDLKPLPSIEELKKIGVGEIGVYLEHAFDESADKFLFDKEKHVFPVYDKIRDYVKSLKGVNVNIHGLECRKDKIELR